jgi:cleavage stimulation factor subunit 1
MSFLVPTRGEVDYIEGDDFAPGGVASTVQPGMVSGREMGRRVDGSPVAVKQPKPELYRAIVRQLVHDGYIDAAEAVMKSTGVLVPRAFEHGDRLFQLFQLGSASEETRAEFRNAENEKSRVEDVIAESAFFDESMHPLATAKFAEHVTTASLNPIRAMTWSVDGQFVACGGTNGSVRLFSMNGFREARRMNPRPPERLREASAFDTKWALARENVDHTQSVEWLSFHPTNPGVLASGGRDGKLVFRDMSTPASSLVNVLPGGKPLIDTYPIRCGAFHPTGGFLFYGTDNEVIRLIDLEKGALFAAGDVNSDKRHTAAMCDLGVSPDGRLLASASFDGTFALFDTTSGRGTFQQINAHSSLPVTSVLFSRSGNILLTAGMDSQSRLWDLRKLNAEIACFGSPVKTEHRIRSRFSCTERALITMDPTIKAMKVIDIFSGNVTATLNHLQEQRAFASNPAELLVAVGGDDARLRVWGPVI